MRIVLNDKECFTHFLEIILERPIEIIYVNARVQEESILGRLMHYNFLRERVNYFKRTEGG